MPDKKLTDVEIKKALECCADEMGCVKGCPCFDPKAKGSHCKVSKKLELEKLTIDLINRLQGENKELKYKVKKWKENYESSQVVVGDFRQALNEQAEELKTAKAEIERLEKGELHKAMTFNNETVKRCASEARKEFAERLLSCYEGFDETNEIILFENLVKAIEDTKRELEKE